MNAAWSRTVSAYNSASSRWIAIFIIIATSACTSAAETQPSQAWDFDLTRPGNYGIQIQHNLNGTAPGSSRVTYTITVGEQTQSRVHELISNRPFFALRLDIQSPQHIRVVVSGLSQVALQNTRVDVLDANSSKSGQYSPAAESGNTKEIHAVNTLLQTPDQQIDLGRVKVAIDKLIDATVDETGTLQQLEVITSAVRLAPEFGNSSDAKVRALRQYLYEPNAANAYRPFQYDLNDPLGHDIRNKLLSNYLTTRKGNCVTMPLLFVILGQRLGIDVTAAMAPKHLLVKFNSGEYGRWINLEATSGANPARDVWIRQQFPSITEEAIANGVYLQPLNKKEVAAEIVETLAEYHYQQQEYDKAILVSSVVLDHYPKDVGAMTLSGAAYLRLLHKHFLDKYPSSNQIPASERGYFQYLAQNNAAWFNKAEALGWRQETKEQTDEYLQKVDRAHQRNASN